MIGLETFQSPVKLAAVLLVAVFRTMALLLYGLDMRLTSADVIAAVILSFEHCHTIFANSE